jgi:type VI secretion system protein ImpK
MTLPVAAAPQAASSGRASPRRGRLALAMQEILTATVRLRANRQVASDAESFRMHIKQLVAGAEQEGRQVGYAPTDARYALYAVVSFLDESVLNCGQPMFADWSRRPLQDEIFGGHIGGEVFFQYLRQLMAREDSEDLADVLEVYQLCLLLGFQGRYSASGRDELQVLTTRVTDQINRIRGGYGELSPGWAPPQGEVVSRSRDRWLSRLGIAAAALFGMAIVLFVLFQLSLNGGAGELTALGGRGPSS